MRAAIGGAGDAIQRFRDQMAVAQLGRLQAQGADSDRARTLHFRLSLTSFPPNDNCSSETGDTRDVPRVLHFESCGPCCGRCSCSMTKSSPKTVRRSEEHT